MPVAFKDCIGAGKLLSAVGLVLAFAGMICGCYFGLDATSASDMTIAAVMTMAGGGLMGAGGVSIAYGESLRQGQKGLDAAVIKDSERTGTRWKWFAAAGLIICILGAIGLGVPVWITSVIGFSFLGVSGIGGLVKYKHDLNVF